MDLDSVTQNTSDNIWHLLNQSRLWDIHGIPWIPLPLPWSIWTPFPWTSKNSGNWVEIVQNWVTSIFYAFYEFPWIPQIISAESMAQSDSISKESTQCFLLMSMQPWMPWKAMEEVEFYRIPRKPWNLICLRIDINFWENGPRTETFILNTIFITNVEKSCLIYIVSWAKI